ncbi:hypothetical protein ASE23_00240 [Rhizobium sp. Root73]|nr:hypothetical protein ASD36_00245 [Rhizobium sp. Root1334]KRC13031.1 hypothetical protein ASE23_00240 [Rhizobium sp. Root73]
MAGALLYESHYSGIWISESKATDLAKLTLRMLSPDFRFQNSRAASGKRTQPLRIFARLAEAITRPASYSASYDAASPSPPHKASRLSAHALHGVQQTPAHAVGQRPENYGSALAA